MNKKNFTSKIEIFVPGIVGICFLILTFFQINVESSLYDDSSNPRTLPILIASFMILITVVRVVYNIFMKENINHKEKNNFINKKVVIGVSLFTLYILFIPFLGFIVATFLSIIGFSYILEKTKWLKIIVFALISTIIIWFSFTYFLKVPLPSGWLKIL